VNLVNVNGELVEWAKAFPRPEWDKPEHWEKSRVSTED
jgi:hypothetical protein